MTIEKAEDPTAAFDVLWKASILFGKPRASWSGTMQLVHRGNHPPKASISFLPMIDMDPTNQTCIYSTLSYVAEHAKKHSATPILTFDQPLWWKSFMIVQDEPSESPLKNIILMMGGLHTKMSFVGAIGYIMANSGLRELMETIYAPNTIDHIFSGKAIARATRAHILVNAALNGLLLSHILSSPLLEELTETPDSNAPLDQLHESLEKSYQK